ncbi:MAG TPA: recombinase family protein, partial [Rhizomicrobium sp.]|nr:recombinase family protein [Rhizomicrobium sp.]
APEIRELMELMRSPEVHGVVAKEFSRLMRPENFGDYFLLQHFADTKTILYLPEGPIDLGSKIGRLMGGVRALFAGVEREEIRERVFLAKEEKRRRGENPQSAICLPFGVGYEKGRGWFYTAEAERVREAFRMLLAGEHSYNAIGTAVGIEPVNLRIILRNPIYSGWRVIDKKRDQSPAALRVRAGGRQGDRPKIARAPDEVIRVRVIAEPLVSEEQFEQAQQIMAIKRTKHWRANPNHVSPYAYHGHLICAVCEELVYTYSNSRGGHYYVCKAKQYPKQAGHKCDTSYMRREALEPQLDSLFSFRLTDRGFLQGIVDEHERRQHAGSETAAGNRIATEIASLEAKKQRVLDAFFEGVISAAERSTRIDAIERDLAVNLSLLTKHVPVPSVTAETLDAICTAFYEWEFLSVPEKRRILAATVPEIRVANSVIHGIALNLGAQRQDEMNRMGTGSSPLRA